jgi:cell division initiation protein
MKIAPIDIAHKTFTRKVMGLDQEEVSDFLRDVADQMEEIIRERNQLKEALRQKDLQLMEFRERDDSLKATIATATKMSDQIRADAEREGKLIVGDAQQKADVIVRDARDQLKRIYQEIADLKRTRMQFEVNVRALCQAHISMLDQAHLTMPDPQINLAAAAAQMSAPVQSAGGVNGAGGMGVGAQQGQAAAMFGTPTMNTANMPRENAAPGPNQMRSNPGAGPNMGFPIGKA